MVVIKSNPTHLFLFLFVAGGVCLMFISFWLRRKLSLARNWKKTKGTILHSAIQRKWVDGRAVAVIPDLVYEYHVDGKKYEGSRLAFIEDPSNYEDSSQENGLKYAPGQTVEVYFDPRKPSSATLITGDPTNCMLPSVMFILGLMLILVGGYCFR